MVFEVASHRGLTDLRVHRQPVRWLFSQYELVQRSNFTQWTGMVTATEIALSRVLGQMFAKKRRSLPPLPTWEQISGGKPAKQQLKQKPPWMVKFEQAQQEQREQDDAS